MTSLSLSKLLGCVCNTSKCLEKNYITWDRRCHDFIHIRMDGCAISDNSVKKCDCLMLYSPCEASQTIVFIVEIKSGGYDISHVRAQLQTCRDGFNSVAQNGPGLNLGVSAVAAKLPTLNRGDLRTAKVIERCLSNVRSQKYKIIPVLYAGKNLSVEKRVGPIRPFRIKNGNNPLNIYFRNRKEDILKCLKPKASK